MRRTIGFNLNGRNVTLDIDGNRTRRTRTYVATMAEIMWILRAGVSWVIRMVCAPAATFSSEMSAPMRFRASLAYLESKWYS